MRGLGALVFAVGLGAASAATAAPGEIHYVQPEGASARAEPRADSPALVRLDRGTKLLEFGRAGAWVRVGLTHLVGKDGWIEAAQLGRRPPGRAPSVPKGKPEPATPIQKVMPAIKTYVLEVSGSPGLDFQSICRVITERAEMGRVELEGSTPDSYSFEALAASCVVRKGHMRGRLEVGLSADDELIATASTAAAFGQVKVRSRGFFVDSGTGNRAILLLPVPAITFGAPAAALGTTVPTLGAADAGGASASLGNTVPSLGVTVPSLGNVVPSLGNTVPSLR